jgi:benzoyl-CoA reductase/2-hydroxyglutaryl-CoA dehydratase subunit BcrC/BadD/HgdB
MKDLKYLKYFEDLLEDADNDLVRQAEAEGDIAVGYTCFHMPEALLNLPGCFSVRLRAPHTTSMEMATYYMANNSCEYARAILERALEGNYSFLHAIAGVDVCEANNRCMENIDILQAHGKDKDKFFLSYLDIPYSDDEDCVEHLKEQLTRKVLKPLQRALRHRHLRRRHPAGRGGLQRDLPGDNRAGRIPQAPQPAHHGL